MTGFTLPQGLKLGTATAATQIEGGDTNCNWYQWSLEGKVGNGESSLTGVDHYNRYKEDIELMASLNQECYRMSIEWSRIEPISGEWSQEGIEHYRNEISLLISRGIEPLVTLHHFSCPQWFQDSGGWLGPDAVSLFLRFCEKIVEELGDIVCEWCTINEPNVFANDTYMDGKYPPGHHGDLKSYFKASRNLVLAHLHVYKMIHQKRKELGFSGETRVGLVHHIAFFEVRKKGFFSSLGKKLISYLFHTIYYRGMVEGRLCFPLGFGYPLVKGRYSDFIGINYYSRHLISGSPNPLKLFGTIDFDPNLSEEQKNDLGWEIYPEGLYAVCKDCYSRYSLPIYITENGIPDKQDIKRGPFIREHLRQVTRLCNEGIPVEKYYYWSLLDNLEWNDGYGPRFGLIEIDYTTMERRVRDSALYYGEICRTKFVRENTNVKASK